MRKATRVVAASFGALAGFGGLEHGYFEILQGNVWPGSIVITSLGAPCVPAEVWHGCEPAMTIIPNFLVTGILTIIVSLAAIVWSAAFVQSKRGGLILILLSIAMLLVGGGFGPPIIGILAGVAGLGIKAPYTWWRTHLPANVRRVLARLWPWVFGVCMLNGVFLVIGSVVLVYLFGVNNPDLFTNSFFFVVLSLPLTILIGIAYDIQNGERGLVVQE